MKQSLFFLPDISGFTDFVQSTEVAHSLHVISELLELLIEANISGLELAEIEGDALFYYKEGDILSQEKLLAQIEHMFNEFYSHLRMLDRNRICPCNACKTAPNLELKIVVHSGHLEFIQVHKRRKPFGEAVIEAHRMLKNSIPSDNYIMISDSLANELNLSHDYNTDLYGFTKGQEKYDGNNFKYIYSVIDPKKLAIKPLEEKMQEGFDRDPDISFTRELPASAERVYEILSNYRFRHEWMTGVTRFEYNENEVTRAGTEHVCVINGMHLDFVAITTEGKKGQLVYGEKTDSPLPLDSVVRMFYVDAINDRKSRLKFDVFLNAKSPIKKIIRKLVVKRMFRKVALKSLNALEDYLTRETESEFNTNPIAEV